MSSHSSQPPEPSHRSPWPNKFIFIAILGGLVLWFREPLWQASHHFARRPPAPNDAASDPPLSDQRYDSLSAEYAPLYEKLGVKPLARELLGNRRIQENLSRLSRNPCDLPAAQQFLDPLMRKREFAVAADFQRAIGEKCPEALGFIQKAGETFMGLGDYASALAAAEKLVRRNPEGTAFLFLQGRALSGLNRHEEALATYVAVARLMGEPKNVRPDVFTRMSDEFEALGRFCEAMAPMETYIAAEPEKRSSPALAARIEDDRHKGNCSTPQPEAVEVLHRLATGLMRTRATINGVEGNFVIDTGASFVALSPEFAKRAKLKVENVGLQQFLTANGAVDAPVVTIDSVRLGRLTAAAVPGVVMPKGVGPGNDGLLGMSFLARFEISLTPTEWRIKAKKQGK